MHPHVRRLSIALGIVTVLAASAAPAAAQVPLADIRVGAMAAMPDGDFSDFYKGGFGAYFRLGLPAGPVKLMGTATYTRFPGKTIGPLEIEDIDVVGLAVGPHLQFPLVDLGLEVGYFIHDDFNKVGWTPSIGVGLLKLDVMASYTMVQTDPKANWLSVGLGFRF